MSRPMEPLEPFPEGFVPGVWRCPNCGEEFRDSEQFNQYAVAWDQPAECWCNGRVEMERIADEEIA